MRPMRRSPVVVASIALFLAVGCKGGGTSNGGGPGSSASPGGSTTFTATGTAHIEMTTSEGVISADAPFKVEPDTDPPPDDLSLEWTYDGGDLYLQTNESFTGTRPTTGLSGVGSPDFVNLVIRVHSTVIASAAPGECDVTITKAEPTAIEGSFTCSGDQPAEGTFEAHAT